MKKSSKRTPRPVKATAFLSVINGFKPLSQEDKQYLFKKAISSINSMQFGVNLSAADFTCISDMLNISLLLAEKNIGREYLAEMYEAREAMQEVKQRYIKTSALGFKGAELQAVKVALTIHQAQIDICTLKEFSDAFDEQERRIKAGDFYKRDGDLSMKERKAA